MKKMTSLFIASIFTISMNAQQVTFESLTLPTSNYWKGNQGIPGVTPFQDNWAIFLNQNDTSSLWGDSWSGWGYSATTDTVDISYTTNQMSCMAGKGHTNSTVYGVAYLGWDSSFNRIRFTAPRHVEGFYITNTTVAYRSMQNGDFTAKKFGGATGNDPDYFRFDVTGWRNGIAKTDTIHFYLADFRDANNANDYIVKDWQYVDLSSLGDLDSLTYNLVSTDNNSFGMLTPSYFAIDDFQSAPLSVNEISDADGIHIYPVPMNDFVVIENTTTNNMTLTLTNINGQVISSGSIKKQAATKVNTAELSKGVYILSLNNGEKTMLRTLIK